VIHATGTRALDRLGGLARGMPRTAAFFLVGAVAISGLPPLNGFVSEWMIYVGLMRTARPGGSMFAAFAAPVLAWVGALAVACFVKALGATFLGTPRTPDAERAQEPPGAMLWPMGLLALLCVFIGVAPMTVAPALDRAIEAFVGSAGGPAASLPRLASLVPLGRISLLGVALLAAVGLVAVVGHRALRAPSTTGTWGCGYAAATPRFQYTASSFADALVGVLSGLLRPRSRRPAISGIFPAAARAEVHVDDVVLERVVRPAFARAGALLARIRVIQAGHLNLYILTILVGALALLLTTVPVLAALRAMWRG
jgi:hydrogenase-4 component B